MDVWFCASRRNPIQKRYEKDCGTYIHPAPSERGQGFVAFPLTLLIMDVRIADFHDKSLSSGARISVGALERACFDSEQVIGSQLSLSAGFLRGAQNQTSIRCIESCETFTED